MVRRTFFFIGLIFLLACAQQVAPTGGPKDSSPPQVLQAKPESQTTNFDAERIEIEFDEFVKLDRLKDQLITSPPLKYDLRTSIRGKTLRIEIKDTLKENTTYVFNFGNAIVDIRENNPLENFTYVFSTGNSIDSSRINGILIDAFEGEPMDEVLVMAYKESEDLNDSLPYLKRPDYLALSNENGYFTLDYLQAGKYKLFALKEDNDNYLFDILSEQIGFLDELIDTETTTDSVEIFIFEEDNEVQFLKEQNETGPFTQLIFNLPIENFYYSTSLLDSITLEPLIEEYSRNSDSIELWWPEVKLRFPLIIEADTLKDTLSLSVDTLRKGNKSPLKIKKLGPYHYYAAPELNFSQPISELDSSKIMLFDKDSMTTAFSIEDGKSARQWQLEFERVEGESYTLILDSGSFTDIYGYQLDSIAYPFVLDESDDFGSLKVNIRSQFNDQLILHLLDQRKSLLRKAVVDGNSHLFEHLKAGVYRLKLIIDKNANGQWDTGNYLEGVQPEKVINFDGEIRIRNRWDKEVDWILF